MTAKIVGLFISNGGVPKLPIETATIKTLGIVGDKQRDLRYHGGLDRALCLYSQEKIAQLQAEGHPIAGGTTGENVLISGIDWSLVKPGARLQLGEIAVEVTCAITPCSNIAASFIDDNFNRIHHKKFPDDSRIGVRVLNEGDLHVGDEVSILD